jgi:hypothetical protein
MAAIRIETLEQRKQAVEDLSRILPDKMTRGELACACALLLQKPLIVRDMDSKNAPTLASDAPDAPESLFDPLASADDFLALMEGSELVVSTHGHDDELPKAEQEVWYSAHSYISGCDAEGGDLRETVARCLAKRLFHDVKYSPAWGNK